MKTNKLILLLAIPTMGLLIACGKSNTNEMDKNNVYKDCSNCTNFTPPGSGNEFFKSTSQDQYGTLVMNLSLMYQVYGTNFNAYYNYNAFVAGYSGMVAAIGDVVFNQNFTMNPGTQEQNNNLCLLPKGNYTARTIQAGQWVSAGVQSMKLQLFGPAHVILSISRAQISAATAVNNVNATGRLSGFATVEAINGNPCQIIFNIQ